LPYPRCTSIICALFVVWALVACNPPRLPVVESTSSGANPSPEPTTVPTPTRVPPAPAANNLVVAIPDEPTSLDPQFALSPSGFEITRNLYETLLRVDEHGNLQPGLAERWSLSADGRSWIFRLRRDSRFQNGRPVDGADVAFSLERLMDPDAASPRAKDYATIQTITISNTYTVTVRTKTPDDTLPLRLAADWAAIVPEEAADRLSERPLGSGAFELAEWARGSYVALRRIAPASDASPGPDEIVFRVIPDDAARVAALKAGEVDIALRIPPSLAVEMKGSPDLTLVQTPANQVKVVSFNEARAPFNDVRVRRALCAAVDRTTLVQSVWQGTAVPVGSELSPAMPAYVDLTSQYAYNPAQARALLQEAGVTTGLSVTITIPPDDEYRRIAEAVASQWAAIGVQATVQPLDWTVFLNQVYFGREFSVTVMTHIGRLDATQALARYVTGSQGDYMSYSSPAYDQLAQQAQSEALDKRPGTFAALQRMLADEAVALYLASPLTTTGLRSNVANYRLLPSGGSDLSQVRKQ
jgi:peptide/nickel transport system substrate-binding protein